jgi:glutathione synthase
MPTPSRTGSATIAQSDRRSPRLLVVMDPIPAIDPTKDSTFAMLLEAQRRGWPVAYAEMADIWIRDGHAHGHVTELRVRDDRDDWFELGSSSDAPLGDFDVILMRKDPPFDTEYIFATYILERAEAQGALVVNRAQSLRDANEKAFVAWFPECAAPTLISRSVPRLQAFIREHGRAVIKPLDRMAGRSVFVTGVQDPNRNVLLDTMTEFGTRTVMAQRYLPAILESGDARILLFDGEPVRTALVRHPPADDHRGNISVGAKTECRPLTDDERRICEVVGPVLREKGLLFVGIDVIGGCLTEINVTSPSGIRELERDGALEVTNTLLCAIESRLGATRVPREGDVLKVRARDESSG